MGEIAGWPVAFRGGAAVAAGVITADVLRGPRFLRLFPDTYVSAPDDGPPDLALRSHAAYRYLDGRGVLSGYSAAEVLGASCGPRTAPAEVTVPDLGQRTHPGLVVHRSRLLPGEITEVNGLRTTSPLRTAYDLAGRGDLVERVVRSTGRPTSTGSHRTSCCTSPPVAVHVATSSLPRCSPTPSVVPAPRWRPGSGC
jgi:hypothetical protein